MPSTMQLSNSSALPRGSQPVLHLLVVDDSEDDAQLVMREFRKEGILTDWRRVDTRSAMEAALLEDTWDLVICDHKMPSFSSAGALDVMRKLALDLPFIIVSGAAPEDLVTAAMRQGAHDFISKNAMVRLVPAARRELKEAALRRDRRGMESRLVASETHRALLAAAVEQVADAIAITDPAGLVSYVNRSFEQLSGCDPAQILGWPLGGLLGGQPLDGMIAQAAAGQVWEGRITLPAGAGAARELDLSCSPVRDPDQAVRNLVAVLRDVTKEVELERQLRQAQKMDALGILAAGVAHDFNNSLTTILASAELIQCRVPEDSPLLPKVEAILHAGHDAAELTRRILGFSRKADEKRVPLDFTTLVRESLRTLQGSLAGNVELSHELTSGVWVEGDPVLLQQVVLNLAINAMQAMQPMGGHLHVSLTEAAPGIPAAGGRSALLTVRDTGCGMDPRVQEQIFEPFFTTKPAGEGTGLGLAMVHATVTKTGGTVTVESAPGQGTTFRVQLPCAPGRGRPSPEDLAGASPAGAEGSGPCILVAEDSHVTCSMLRSWLERAGYRVRSAKDGLEAWEQFSQQGPGTRFDLLLTDVVMPRMDGLELVQMVRKAEPAMLIGVLTSNEDKETVKTALHLGVDAFLNKPFSREELLDSVAGLLAKRSSRVDARRSLETARAVRQAQRSMAAAPEQGVPLFTLYEPLTDAGGDLFRCFTGADGAILFVLADVAGHSVLSSYAVASFLGALAAWAEECLGAGGRDQAAAGDAMETLARHLNLGIQTGPFADVPVCVLLGLWHQGSGRVRLLNAGIPHGLHLSRREGRARPLAINGTPLGLFPEPVLEGMELRLEPGDRLLLGSDGFFEARSAARDCFQETAPGHWEALADTPLDWALSAICETVRIHAGGVLADDLLVVGFEQPSVNGHAVGELVLRFPSTTRAVDLACDRLKEHLKASHGGWTTGPERRFDIVLAVREALTNAVLHGNSGRASAVVLLRCLPGPAPGLLTVSVQDEGPGFDLEAHRPPEDPLSEQGRGITLIRHLAHSVRMAGQALTMTFQLEETSDDDR